MAGQTQDKLFLPCGASGSIEHQRWFCYGTKTREEIEEMIYIYVYIYMCLYVYEDREIYYYFKIEEIIVQLHILYVYIYMQDVCKCVIVCK
jgi:hypothetical protein